MSTSKTLIAALLFLSLAGSASAGFFPGALRDHGHTAAGDGGALANPAITGGDITPDSVTATSMTGVNFSSAPVMYIGDGAAATPGLRFSNDTNSGIYRSGSDSWYLVAGGSSRLRIEAGVVSAQSGNVFQAPFGTVGVPSYGFTSGGNNGMYYDGGVAISQGGTQRFLAHSSGVTLTGDVNVTGNFNATGKTYVIAEGTWSITGISSSFVTANFGTEKLDNLNEFDGTTFTASATTGIYNITSNFDVYCDTTSAVLMEIFVDGPVGCNDYGWGSVGTEHDLSGYLYASASVDMNCTLAASDTLIFKVATPIGDNCQAPGGATMNRYISIKRVN